MAISEQERAQRATDVARIRHSTEMEGGRIPDETLADLTEFVAGDVDEAELIRRTRARFGLDG